MAINPEVGGFSGPKKVGEVTKTRSVSTVRFKSDGVLDVEIDGDGSLTILQIVKQVGDVLSALSPSDPPEAGWEEIVKIPASGTKVTVSFAVRTEFVE